MPQKYFEKFPVTTYSNTQVVDITRRVAALDRVVSNPYVYYPYEITTNERADQLSSRYYNDPFRSWIFYLTNKITDPYYEWYLSENEFNNFLVKKYESLDNAYRKVKYYRNKWENTDNLDVSGYNALTPNMQIYWEPVFGSGGRVQAYKRRQTDWKANTNKIVKYKVSNTNFIIDEICTVIFDDYNSGRGQVLAINRDSANTANSEVHLQHVSGAFFTSDTVQISNTSYLYGNESNVNTQFTDVQAMANNLAEEVISYWAPVTYFEYEQERNEFNKTVNVLDSNFKQIIADNLEELFKE